MSTAEFLATLARSSLAAGVLVLLVLVTQRVFRRHLSPCWNCALWLLVVARLLPFSLSSDVSVFNFVPGWTQPSQPDARPAAAPLPQFVMPPSPTGAAAPASAVSDRMLPGDVRQAAVAESWWVRLRHEPALALLWLWLAGAIALATGVVVSTVALARATVRATPVSDPDVLARLRECCAAMRVRRMPRLVESAAVATPALHGLIRPRVLLPPGFTSQFSAAEQRFVFLHELAHIRRGDLWLNWLTTTLQILHWFNPLVWLAFARWRSDREIACDAAALEAAGAESSRRYGETMLRLLENFVAPARRPALVGILEDNRQLHQRMKMIAGFTPARRPIAAAGLLAILGLVGLTDAQVATDSPLAPSNSASATPATSVPVRAIDNAIATEIATRFGGDRRAYLDHLKSRGLTQREYRREVEEQLRTSGAPPATTDAPPPAKPHVLLLVSSTVKAELVEQVRQTQDVGASFRLASFASADEFGALLETFSTAAPERIVLLTDGLPKPAGGQAADPQSAFRAALRRLPPRIPVHTVLVPGPSAEPAAAGTFWELANATRGQLTTLAHAATEPRTHLAFVVDTSGSMRDPNTGGVWPIVINALEATLDAQPQLTSVQLIDGDGRFILGRPGKGANAWLPNTPATREAIRTALGSYKQDTVSNPVPGVSNAIRFLHDKTADLRMGITILGDEFNSTDDATVVLDRIAALNPPAATTGRRAITISAIGFPTTIRYQFSMGNTGLRFADLMRQLTAEHGGSFIGLPDL